MEEYEISTLEVMVYVIETPKVGAVVKIKKFKLLVYFFEAQLKANIR